MKPYLSLIFPAYNEEFRISKSLDTAFEYLSKQSYSFEVIVVDDGSKDKTVEVVSRLNNDMKIIKQPRNLGKGAAVRRGMLEANGTYRVFSDSDLSTPIYELEKLLTILQNSTDVCIGSRGIDSSLIKEHQPFYREFMGRFFNQIVQLYLLKGIKDTQCGFKGFKEKAAIDIFSNATLDGFSFDVEILFLARKLGYTIKEVAVEWFNDDRTTVDPFKDSIRMLFELIKIKRLHK